MFQSILAILFILKLVKRSKFYASEFLLCLNLKLFVFQYCLFKFTVNLRSGVNDVYQGCPTRGPRAACDPRSLLVWPAKRFLIGCSIILNRSAFKPPHSVMCERFPSVLQNLLKNTSPTMFSKQIVFI